MDMRIIGGFCPGVERAYKMVLKLQEKNPDKQVVLLGELVHNKDVLAKLEESGIVTVDSVDDLASVDTDKTLLPIIRAHGTTIEDEEYLKGWLAERYGSADVRYMDLTCIYVKKGPQKSAADFSEQGYKVVVFGKKGHPEVEGIASRAKDVVIYEKPEDVDPADFLYANKVCTVAQTTSEITKYFVLEQNLRDLGLEVEIVDTYCDATKENQGGIKGIAEWADMVVVVGGSNSSNTKKLYDICSRDVTTYKIENSDGLQPEWFKDRPQRIGIAAGASTPPWAIDDVKETIERYYI
jgi:4-hydroxy-3-methylbut-2-enyl diphosphate reductase